MILLDRSTCGRRFKNTLVDSLRRFFVLCLCMRAANITSHCISKTHAKWKREQKEKKSTQFRWSIVLCGACSSSLLILLVSPFSHFPLFFIVSRDLRSHTHRGLFRITEMARTWVKMRKLKVRANEIRDEKLRHERYKETERERESSIDLIFSRTCAFRRSELLFSNKKKSFSLVWIFRSVKSHSGISWDRTRAYICTYRKLQCDFFFILFA